MVVRFKQRAATGLRDINSTAPAKTEAGSRQREPYIPIINHKAYAGSIGILKAC